MTTNLDTIKCVEIFSFYRGSSPTVTPFICPVWAFFLFEAMFFKTKSINEHVWSFNLLTITNLLTIYILIV